MKQYLKKMSSNKQNNTIKRKHPQLKSPNNLLNEERKVSNENFKDVYSEEKDGVLPE
jgi:hypothetical protein